MNRRSIERAGQAADIGRGGVVTRTSDSIHPRHERGAVAVELALVLPILLLLVMGIIEFSRAYNAKEVLQYAVREGARDLALGKTEAVAALTVSDRAGSLNDPAAIGITMTSCPSPLPSLTPGDPPPTASVTATYSLAYNVPFFSSGNWDLSATGTMRCAG